MERSLTIDFLRGFAIWMMVVLHVFLHVYDYKWAYDMDVLLSQPLYVIILIGLLVYLGSWAGLFLLISISANAISFIRNVEKGKSLNKIMKKQLLAGVAVLIVAFLSETLLGYPAVLGVSLGNSAFTFDPFYRGLFNFETLNAVGWSIIICSIVMYLLFKNEEHKNTRRNIKIISIFILLVLIITPLLDLFIRRFFYPNWPNDQYDWPPESAGEFVLRKFFIFLNGHLEPMFPFLATAFIGLAFGILLAEEVPPKNMPKHGVLIGLGLLVVAVLMAFLGTPVEPSFMRPSLFWYLLGLGGQVLVFSGLLWIIEFKGHTSFFTGFSLYFRRWGILALTIYTMQIWDFIPRYLMHWVFGWPVTRFSLNIVQTLIMLVIIVGFWDISLYIWAKVNYFGSFEWMIVNGIGRLSGIRSRRTDLNKVLYEIEPMDFSKYYKTPETIRSFRARDNPKVIMSLSVGLVIFLTINNFLTIFIT